MMKSQTVEIVCFGAAHIDNKAFSLNNVVWGQKNPSVIKSSFGGVARNVAENLSRVGVNVGLVSRVGRDEKGDLLERSLKERNISVEYLSRSLLNKTASYTALLEPDGSLAVAFSDMAIYDEMCFDSEILEYCSEAKVWLIDANIPEASLKWLAKNCPPQVRLWAIGVSVAKNKRFLPILDFIELLVVNEQEFSALDANRSKTMVITKGDAGAMLYQRENQEHFLAMPAEVVDVTGAGDAFCAGLLYGYLRENSFQKAMPFAMALASLTIKTTETVCESLDEKSLLHNARIYCELFSNNA